MWTFVGKLMFLLFNTLSRFVITLLPRSKRLLVSWLLSLSAVILRPKRIKSIIVSTFFLSICHEVMGQDVMILVFLMFSFKPVFSLFSFIRRLFSSSLSAISLVSSAYLRLLMFLLPILIPACAKSTLPVFYKWNNGVWMSAHLFTMWLNEYVKLTLLDLLLRKKRFLSKYYFSLTV